MCSYYVNYKSHPLVVFRALTSVSLIEFRSLLYDVVNHAVAGDLESEEVAGFFGELVSHLVSTLSNPLTNHQ